MRHAASSMYWATRSAIACCPVELHRRGAGACGAPIPPRLLRARGMQPNQARQPTARRARPRRASASAVPIAAIVPCSSEKCRAAVAPGGIGRACKRASTRAGSSWSATSCRPRPGSPCSSTAPQRDHLPRASPLLRSSGASEMLTDILRRRGRSGELVRSRPARSESSADAPTRATTFEPARGPRRQARDSPGSSRLVSLTPGSRSSGCGRSPGLLSTQRGA